MSTIKRVKLFEDCITKEPTTRTEFSVPENGWVEMQIRCLPEGTIIWLNQITKGCDKIIDRWPVLNCCCCPSKLTGPANCKQFKFYDCGDFELMLEGPLGDTEVHIIPRDTPPQHRGCNCG